MNQPAPKPKTFYEKTVPELKDELVKKVGGGNYQFSPANYQDQIAFLQAQESSERANTIAERSARTARLGIFATIGAAVAAVVSAVAAVLALNHQTAAPPSPVPIIITQTAVPPAPVTITQTVLPAPSAPTHP
ncbi:hypothetical protein [Mycobacterium sp. Lab-001]|uniref:hypothetical protein n=1 Tax=Mycobacterium sp. Lab-001 TaxID=3410136 RepID=UPI003D17A65E